MEKEEKRETLSNDAGDYYVEYSVSSDTLKTVSRPKLNGAYKYECPWDTWKMMGFTDALELFVAGSGGETFQRTPPSKEELDRDFPIFETDWAIVKAPNAKEITTTWIGHSTFLVQMDGINFLTDPIFSERCSPVPFAGPKRYRKTPFEIKDLPPIDFVVISHSHYDHLDKATVKALPKNVMWIVGQGLKDWFTAEGIPNVVELDWWEQITLVRKKGDVVDVKKKSELAVVTNSKRGNDEKEEYLYKVTFTPTQHWSNRGLFDRNISLWGSFVVETSSGKKVFFGGDTGYCSAFREIGLHLGPMDLGLIPIGAYQPRNFMKFAHVNPEEAVRIHLDVKSKRSIGCHWGTFILTGEPVLDPPKVLAEELKKLNLPSDCFIALNIGESFIIDAAGKTRHTGRNPNKAQRGSDSSDSEEPEFFDANEAHDADESADQKRTTKAAPKK